MKLLIVLAMLIIGLSACQDCTDECGNCYEVHIYERNAFTGHTEADTFLMGNYCGEEMCEIDGSQEPLGSSSQALAIERYCIAQ